MSDTPPVPPAGLRRIVAIGLFASPAAAAWIVGGLVAGQGRRRLAACLRVAGIAATIVIALGVLILPVRWEAAAALWSGFCVATTAGLAGWARATGAIQPVSRPVHEGRARDAIRAIAAVVFVMPPLVMFAHLVGAASAGWLLVRFDPSVGDPSAMFGSIAWGFLFGIPIGVAFVVLSQRRGHLKTPADLGRAALSYAVVLILTEICLSTSATALRTIMIGAELASGSSAMQDALLHAVLYTASIPLALRLAWGGGRGARRLLGTMVLLVAGLANLLLVLGYTARVQFVLGRQLEKSGRIEAALRWYGRSLSARSTPLIESYLQHRIGLIDYKLGHLDQAAASFRLVQTSRNANKELVRQSAHYLDQLARHQEGRRVVLEGVEVRTELRESYCAPNTLALVMNYWGHPLSPAAIGEKVALIGGGTPLSGIRFLCEENGLDHWVVPFATIADLRWLVDRGLPVLAYLPGHVLAVFGYDTRLGTLVTYDTATWDIWVDEPQPDFLEQWGRTLFLMGVVLPRDGGPPAAGEIRRRFSGRSSEAAWHWWLSREVRSRDEAAAHLRAALVADPAFFPAAFEILTRSPSDRAWVRDHTDGPGIVAGARALLKREHASHSIAGGLARWHYLNQDWQALLDLVDWLDQHRRPGPGRLEAGIAAARLGRWARAAYLLGAADTEDEGEAALYEALAQETTGRNDEAVTTAAQVIAENRGDVLEPALDIIERFGAARGPGFLADVYHDYLQDRPFDIARQIRMASLTLEAISRGGSRNTRTRLHRARLAAHLAEALAERPEDRARAAKLARRLDDLQLPSEDDSDEDEGSYEDEEP
jgi:tetratricopeptide (TPR) repeat protein